MHMTPIAEMTNPHSIATGPPDGRTTEREADMATHEFSTAKARPRIAQKEKRSACTAGPPRDATSSRTTAGFDICGG